MVTSGRSRRRGKRASDDRYSVTIRFMVPPRLADKIESAADQAGVSLSEWVRNACLGKLLVETDYLDAEESRLMSELEGVKEARAEKMRSEIEADERARQKALEKQRARTAQFDETLKTAIEQMSPSNPARLVLHETGLSDLLDLDPVFIERIPEGPLKDAAKAYLEG